MIEKSPFLKIGHIGIVVRDLDKAAQYYESLGIGPFQSSGVVITETRAEGDVIVDWKLKVKFAQLGPIQLELVQPVEGESIQKKFLESKGEGVNHIGFFVDNIEEETVKLKNEGFTTVYSVKFQNGGGVAYFDNQKAGGLLFELIQRPPK